jgi:hypothetical protein
MSSWNWTFSRWRRREKSSWTLSIVEAWSSMAWACFRPAFASALPASIARTEVQASMACRQLADCIALRAEATASASPSAGVLAGGVIAGPPAPMAPAVDGGVSVSDSSVATGSSAVVPEAGSAGASCMAQAVEPAPMSVAVITVAERPRPSSATKDLERNSMSITLL